MPERLLLSLTAFAAAGAKRDILRRQRRHLLNDMPRDESLFEDARLARALRHLIMPAPLFAMPPALFSRALRCRLMR
jgi:hypothetical protein